MKLIISLLIYLIFIITSSMSLENKIILKIENSIITSIDIENEKKYLMALNPNTKNIEKNKLNLISKNSLIREKIKEKEILKYMERINLKKDFLDKLIKERYSRLNLSNKEEFLNYLKNNQIDIKIIEKKISIEALWNQLIYQKFYKNVKIDKKKLEEQINLKKKQRQKTILLSEIVFKIESKDSLNNKYLEILDNIKKYGFESAALTYSISDSSSLGGKLGWIKQSSLNKNINKELSDLNINDLTKPIFTPNGYLILKIDDIKFSEINFDRVQELNNLIKLKTNEQLNQQSTIYFNKVKKNLKINEL